MSLKLAARLVIVDSRKIADLQENDTAAHTLDISSFVPPATLAVLILATRISGTGLFYVFPKSHASRTYYADVLTAGGPVVHPITNREIKWKNSVANDDWDLYLHGYFVQKRTR